MQIELKDKEKWNNFVTKNIGPYGKGCVDYAERWAIQMQERLAKNEKLENIAKEESHKADTEGITGFMYGCAVNMLSQCWKYGEELRIWHNLDIQIEHEGDLANKEGKVLNPALLNISVKE